MALANINLKFGINMESFRSSMQKAERSLKKFGKNMERVGKRLSIGVTLPIAAIGAASLQAASDAEETESKFNTVFRNIQADAQKSMKILRNEYGLSSRASQQLLADTGDLLTGFGFSQEAALTMSEEVNKLAVDLASFTNFSGGAEGASKALTSALLGEREAAKSLGIAITENEVKKQMATNAAKGLTFESERMAKAQATLDIALRQSANAIGDYARTQESFANQSRLMRARLEDIGVELGKVFLPLATKVVAALTKMVNWFSNLDDSTKKVIVVVAGIVAAIGPLLTTIGFLTANILPAMKAGFAAVSLVMSPIALKIAAIVAVVGGLVLVGKAVIDSWDTVKEFFSQMWDKVKLMFINGVASLLKAFNKFTKIVGIDFSNTIHKLESNAKGIRDSLDAKPVVTFGDTMSEIGKNIMNTFDSVKESVMGASGAVEDLNTTTTNANGNIGGGANKITHAIDNGIASPSRPGLDFGIDIKGKVKGISDRIRESTPMLLGAAQDMTWAFSNIIHQGFTDAFTGMGEAIGSSLANGTNMLQALGSVLLSTIGNMATQLGKAAIAIGVGMKSIKLAFKNPFTAIAAGVALVALGSFISNKVSKMTSGGSGGGSGGGDLAPPTTVPARAMGGAVQMGQPYLVGERGPELFTPSGFGSITNARQTAAMGMMKEIKVVVEGMLSGRDIYLAGEEYVRVNGRTT